MQNPLYNSPTLLKQVLSEHNLSMQKKFGQNFLIDENIRRKLCAQLDLDRTKSIWEIGPGLGSMTELLLQTDAELTAFEIDRGFIKFLHEAFDGKKNFTLIEGDVLKTWRMQGEKKVPDYFFGNLPYNIAATLILDTIEAGVIFPEMLITVQKEVAERFAAHCGSDYSIASVLVQAYYRVETVQTIAPSAFWPAPNVASKAISLKRGDTYSTQIAGREKLFFSLVKGLFFARRKTLKNNFQKWLQVNQFDPQLLERVLPPEWQTKRAETLTVQDFVDLLNRLPSAEKLHKQ